MLKFIDLLENFPYPWQRNRGLYPRMCGVIIWRILTVLRILSFGRSSRKSDEIEIRQGISWPAYWVTAFEKETSIL
jgi:hypothetical protein